MPENKDWSHDLVYAVNAYKPSYIREQLRQIMLGMTDREITFVPDISWAVNTARRRISAAPLDIQTADGSSLATLWIQSQNGLSKEPELVSRYGDEEAILAVKFERPLEHNADAWSVWQEHGYDTEWYPHFPINEDRLLAHRRFYVISQDYTITLKVDENGRFIQEGIPGNTSRTHEDGIPTMQFATTQFAPLHSYAEYGTYTLDPIDRFFSHIEGRVMPVIRNIRDFIRRQEIVPIRARYALRPGPWRRVGIAQQERSS